MSDVSYSNLGIFSQGFTLFLLNDNLLSSVSGGMVSIITSPLFMGVMPRLASKIDLSMAASIFSPMVG